MEELLEETTDTPEELTARAGELREGAEANEMKGQRNAALALADRYEQAAASRFGRANS